MAGNSDETKRKIRYAAAAEFARSGLAGTTMEQIARSAGVNKERIYAYFGSKEELFGTVLGEEMAELAVSVQLRQIECPRDVGEYAGRIFDYHAAHPLLIRLLIWEGLESLGAVSNEEIRTAHYRDKISLFEHAQSLGQISSSVDAADMAFLVIALAGWWHAVPQVVRMMYPAQDPLANRARRDAVVQAATQMAAGSVEYGHPSDLLSPLNRETL